MASIITNLSLGGSGGINFVADASAEAGLGAWKTYNDGASVAQTGAGNLVVSGLTIGLNTTSALRGTQSYIATKAAANCQGMGWAYDFTIDSNDQGRVVALTFDYLIAGTFNYGLSTSDVQMYIYDKVNGTMQQFAPNYFTGPKDKWRGIFQAAYNSTQYRLVFHVATTNTSAWTFTYDNVKCGPQMESGSNQGSIVTDWQSYSPSFINAPTSGATGFWRRVGGSIECQVGIPITGASSGVFQVGLPAGLNIDYSKMGVGFTGGAAYTLVGFAEYRHGSGGQVNPGTVATFSSSTNSVYIQNASSYSDWGGSGAVNGITVASGDDLTLNFTAPILGWSSGGIVMQQDTDTRVVAYSGNYTNGQSISGTNGSNIVMNFGAQVDTVGGWNSTTNTYTVQVPGIYDIFYDVRAATGDGGDKYVYLNINGTNIDYLDIINYTGNIMTKGGKTVSLKTGDTVKLIFWTGSGTTTSTLQAGIGGLYIRRLSGPSAIAATELVVASYTSANSSLTAAANNTTPVPFPVKIKDSHGAYSSSGVFTCPIPGTYRVDVNSYVQPGTGTFWSIAVFQNGVMKSYSPFASAANPQQLQSFAVLQCNAGDTLDIRPTLNSGSGSVVVGLGSSARDQVSFTRIGN